MSTSKENSKDKEVKAKRKGRGISNATRSTSRKKVVLEDIVANNMPVMIPDSVTFSMATYKEGTNSDFAGMVVPTLVFTFKTAQYQTDADKKWTTDIISPAPSNSDTIPGGKEEWKVNAPLSKIKHYLDVMLLKGRPLTEEEEDALILDYVDYEEPAEGVYNYTGVDDETLLKAWAKMFEAVAEMFNSEEAKTKVYADEKGKPRKYWYKHLRYTKNKKNGQWSEVAGGDLGIPTFIGEGIIEEVVPDTIPKIGVNMANEKLEVIKDFVRGGNTNQFVGGVQRPNIPIQQPNMMQAQAASGADGLPF